MKVKIVRGVIVGGQAAAVGDVVEVDDVEAGFLVSIGKAELYVEPVKKDVPPVDPPPKMPTNKKMKKAKVGG